MSTLVNEELYIPCRNLLTLWHLHTHFTHFSNDKKYHSRFFASLDGRTPSALCAADKLAMTIVPKRLYLALIHLSGEVDEYLEHFRKALNSSSGKYALEALNVPSAAYEFGSVEHWYASAMLGNQRWIAENTNRIYSEQSTQPKLLEPP
jgi:hypothetical protein